MNRIKNYQTAARLVLVPAMAVNLFAFPLASQAAAYSYTDLQPSDFVSSFGLGISGGQQVGVNSVTSVSSRAFLWSGTAASVVDLTPSGFNSSYGSGTSGSQQIGFGWGSGTGLNDHALLWSGTANSFVDLNPSGFVTSQAVGISGSRQVGSGWGAGTGGNTHALLWSGTASSAVDLNPTGFTWSDGLGMSGSLQVGYGFGSATGNKYHALLWSGTASSAVDLQSFLSSDYSDSIADGIDTNGNIVGRATYVPTGQEHAILWSVVPEPGTVTLLTLGGAALLMRKRFKQLSPNAAWET